MDVNATTPEMPMMNVPSIQDGDRAVHDAKVIFARSLAHWTSDLLVLRQASRLRPTWTDATEAGGRSLAA